jgi:hypothetical protein
MLLLSLMEVSLGKGFEIVPFIGACGDVDWTKTWTDFTPLTEEYPQADVPLQGIINKYTILRAAHTYRLIGKVYVTDQACLYIEPGTIIRADYKSALVITRGAKIRAMGTKELPIIFTSNQAPHLRNKGDWSGLVILGNAPVNLATGVGRAEGDLDPLYNQYGGTNAEDHSGELRYVRVEFAGRRINKDHEFNGISFYAVGRSTYLDFLMSSYSGDDGIQFFGGCVDASHLVSFQAGDDCFEFSEGYSGHLQFGISLRHFNLGDVSGSRSMDGQSSMAGILDMKIPTKAVLSNFTLISPEIFYNQTATSNIKDAIHYEGGAAYSLHNSLVIGFPVGIAIDGQESITLLESGEIQLRNTLFIGCQKPAVCQPNSFDINSWFVTPAYANVFRPKSDVSRIFTQPFSLFKPDFRTQFQTFQVKPDFRQLEPKVVNVMEAGSTYLGAFDEHDWTAGWTAIPSKKNISPTLIVQQDIRTNTTWTQDQIYQLKGQIKIKNGVTLRIEPGTLVLAEAGACLLVEPLAGLLAEGEVNNPIIFSQSSLATGAWKGVVLCGNARLAPEDLTSLAELEPHLPAIPIASGGFENQISLEYCRIEYAGEGTNNNQGAALQIIARSKAKTKIEFLQISQSVCDGIRLSGGDAAVHHLFSLHQGDEDVVCQAGYAGRIQFACLVRQALLAANKGTHAIEINSCVHASCYPVQVPQLKNISMFGPVSEEHPQINQNYSSAVLFTSGGAAQLSNCLITAFPVALEWQGSRSIFFANAGLSYIRNSMVAQIPRLLLPETEKLVQLAPLSDPLVQKTQEDLLLKPLLTTSIKALPSSNSPCLKPLFIQE